MSVGSGVDKVSAWRARLARFEESGLTVVDFCLEEGVSTASFYDWRKRLAASRSETVAIDGDSSGFAAVRLFGSTRVLALLPGGTRLEIPSGDGQALRLVVEILARADAERAGEISC